MPNYSKALSEARAESERWREAYFAAAQQNRLLQAELALERQRHKAADCIIGVLTRYPSVAAAWLQGAPDAAQGLREG